MQSSLDVIIGVMQGLPWGWFEIAAIVHNKIFQKNWTNVMYMVYRNEKKVVDCYLTLKVFGLPISKYVIPQDWLFLSENPLSAIFPFCLFIMGNG